MFSHSDWPTEGRAVADLKWDDLSVQVIQAGSEEHLARRMVKERQRRGWSQERLAKEMTEAGCPTSQSSISKIERPVGVRRRDITADEAIALSRVFKLPLGELLLPDGVDGALLADLAGGARLARELSTKESEYQTLIASLATGTRGSAEWDKRIQEQFDVANRELARWGEVRNAEQAEIARARMRFMEDLTRAREESQ